MQIVTAPLNTPRLSIGFYDCKKCTFAFIRYFVSKGAVVDQKGGILNATPLHWAVR